jgi:biotin carboxyl carrier protein
MMQRIRISHEGKEVVVIAQKLQGKLWFHLNGETHVFEPAGEKRSSKGSGALNPEVLEAPMPGKILRVEVKPGDVVKIGQVLIVMEAMKMEYTLAAAIGATVTDIGCKIGEQVKLGQTLVRLKGKA